ncbi:MAG: NADH-quinone oxidoreductase subunit J, partial [Deltaproteobacteria bacterium]
MGAWILFAVVALLLVGSALMVVLSMDLVHTVLWLAVGLVTTAVVYVALSADFLAAAQVLLYTGGVVTLMLFAVMLTRRLAGAGVAV